MKTFTTTIELNKEALQAIEGGLYVYPPREGWIPFPIPGVGEPWSPIKTLPGPDVPFLNSNLK